MRLSLVIDATFDHDSYHHNPIIWKDYDIELLKLSTKDSMSKPPPLKSLWTFIKKVKEVLRSDPKGHILVYSKLGHNVPGFYIVGYMCEILHMKLSEALNAFKECREPGIYSKSTLQALQFINEKRWSRRRRHRRQDVSNSKITLPSPPSWDVDYDQNDLSKKWLEAANPIVRDPPPVSSSSCTKKRSSEGAQQIQRQQKRQRAQPSSQDDNFLVAPDGTKTQKMWVKEMDAHGFFVFRNTQSDTEEKVNMKLPSPWTSQGWHLMRNTKGNKLYWWNKNSNKSIWREGKCLNAPPGMG